MITTSNSLCRERDAQSSGRRSTSRHVRFRAVPRTNRTQTTANTHNHSATSSTTEPPTCAPSLLWQCFCADASPGECTDVASPGWTRAAAWAASTSKKRNKELPCLLMCPSRCLPSTGVLTRNHPHVGADLLAARKPSRSSDDQHVGECRERTHAGMGHQSQHLGSFLGFLLDGCG